MTNTLVPAQNRSSLDSAHANKQTLTTDLVLADYDLPLQALNPGAASRSVTLPGVSKANHQFVITNTAAATYTLAVKSGVTTLITLAPGETVEVVSDSFNWRIIGGSGSSGGVPVSLALDSAVAHTAPTDIATFDASASAHGLMPKADKVAMTAMQALGLHSLTDPGADRILFWDESSGAAGATAWLTVSTGLAISDTSLALSHLGIEALTDPAADRVMFWDDSAGVVTWLTMGASLSISGTTLRRAALTGDVTAAVNSNTTAIASGVIIDDDINASAAIALSKLATQAANTIVANATAGAAVPTALAIGANTFPATASAGTLAAKTITDFGLSLVDDSDAATARTTLGLGSMATETATNYVAKALFDAHTILYAAADDTPAALTITANTFPARSSAGNMAAKSITDFALTILDDADAATVRATIGAGTGSGTVTSVTGTAPVASSGGATPAISLGVSAADKYLYSTALNTWTEGTVTSFARSILDDANEATFKATVNLEIGTDVQAYSANLGALAGLAVTDGNFAVGNGATWVAESGATARTSLGLGTIATQAANSVSISGGTITGITDLTLADGGTGASLVDPDADRIMFWDDSAGAVTWLTAGTGLSITTTTIACTITQYTDELAQDAVGGMVDSTLVYTDATPSLGRAAISGDITIAAGSNTAAIGSGVIVNADVNGSAAIDLSKLASQAANTLTGNPTAGAAVPTAFVPTGDVTLSLTALTIGSQKVTIAKMYVSATDKLLGRDTAGAGAAEELGVSSPLSITGGNLTHLATAGNIHLPAAGSANQLLKNSGVAGTGTWCTVTESSGALAAVTTIGMSGQLTSTLATGTAPLVIASTTRVSNLNVAKAGVADTVTVADAAADTTTFPMLAGSATGDLGPLTDAGLSYNASTNVLTATGGAVLGAGSGTYSSAATGTLSINVTAAKTLTLTSADTYTVTFPATGTTAMLGVANVYTANQSLTAESAYNPQLTLTNAYAGATAGYILMRHARGSIASPSAISSGDTLGNINFYGHDGSNYTVGAALTVAALAAPSAGVVQGRMIFSAYNSAGAAVEVLRMDATEVRFNEAGLSTLDFIVETHVYNAITVDASDNNITIMSNASGKIGFFGATPIVKGSTGTSVVGSSPTYTVPGSPDYAWAGGTNSSAWGWTSQAEFESACGIIKNTYDRLGEIATLLHNIGIITVI